MAETTILCQHPAGIPLGLTGPFKFIVMIILINTNELMNDGVTLLHVPVLLSLLVRISAQKQNVCFLITPSG